MADKDRNRQCLTAIGLEPDDDVVAALRDGRPGLQAYLECPEPTLPGPADGLDKQRAVIGFGSGVRGTPMPERSRDEASGWPFG